jgi:hypothetical protein
MFVAWAAGDCTQQQSADGGSIGCLEQYHEENKYSPYRIEWTKLYTAHSFGWTKCPITLLRQMENRSVECTVLQEWLRRIAFHLQGTPNRNQENWAARSGSSEILGSLRTPRCHIPADSTMFMGTAIRTSDPVKFLRNVDGNLPGYMTSRPRRQYSSKSPWEPRVQHKIALFREDASPCSC